MSERSYFEQVYEVVRRVPRGRITTYGAIADFLALGAARMVGWALNNSFLGDGVPAHRVVNRKGELSGRHHFNPPSLMQHLLEQEGVVVVDDQVQHFDELFWHPAHHLNEDDF